MIKITKNWFKILEEEFKKPYFADLQNFLNTEYNSFTIYPSVENIFNSLNLVKYADVKVVILGQDPYHEPNQAHGLAFSVKNGELPPSLQNIYKEMNSDLGVPISKSGDLTCWAKQGVLLLNTVLTVRKGQANSHKGKGWEEFTTKIIELLNEREKPIVFILWGNQAKKLSSKITNKNHLVLCSAHPSPLSAYNGFFGCKHFSKTNEFLLKNNIQPINWEVK